MALDFTNIALVWEVTSSAEPASGLGRRNLSSQSPCQRRPQDSAAVHQGFDGAFLVPECAIDIHNGYEPLGDGANADRGFTSDIHRQEAESGIGTLSG